jgi:hypothetical protein
MELHRRTMVVKGAEVEFKQFLLQCSDLCEPWE